MLKQITKRWLSDIRWFSRLVVRRPLYRYQLDVAQAIVDSVLHQRGREFAVMFPRQSGKNETQSQVEAYLLNLFQRIPGAAIVKAQPTFRPQALNALMRLERSLDNGWNRGRWKRMAGYLVALGQAQMAFFSAEPSANTVGHTATLLLECDEAQDVLEAEWDRKFVPMAASRNATIVYWGTAWTRRTLLARAIRYLRELEARDGIRRVFVVSVEQVAAENPAYGEFVARQVARQGRQHPLVRTQYFNEEIDAEGGMFPPARRALMQGSHPPRPAPAEQPVYALLLDVAGEDEGAAGPAAGAAAGLATDRLANPGRDATVLTLVEVDLATLADPVLAAPTYRAVLRRSWLGTRHTALYAEIRALAEVWRARYLVADATGVGAGLVAFLARALPQGPGRCTVIPFEFNAASKSQLGWDFLAVCDTGRWKEYAAVAAAAGAAPDAWQAEQAAESARFWREVEFCQYEALPGPARSLRWGVPAGTRDPATGELVHDDALLSAALCAVLDRQAWGGYQPAQVQADEAARGRKRGKF